MNYGYVYITENKINGRKYIGQHKAKEFDTNYLGSGIALREAIKKYGVENFEVSLLEWANSKSNLDDLEITYIAKYDAVNNDAFYNIADGGQGGNFLTGEAELNRLHNLKIACSDTEMLNKRVAAYKQNWVNKTDEEKAKRNINIKNSLNSRTPEEKALSSKKHSNTLQNASEEWKQNKSNKIKESLANRTDDEKQLQRKRFSKTMQNKSDEEKLLWRQHISEGVKRRNMLNTLEPEEGGVNED